MFCLTSRGMIMNLGSKKGDTNYCTIADQNFILLSISAVFPDSTAVFSSRETR